MMKNIKLLTLIIFIILLVSAFFSCGKIEDSQSPDQEEQPEQQELTEQQKQLLQELNQWLVPLEHSPLNLTDTELSFLDQLSSARLVGLGEATHGTREFFQMKHRIFEYLVEYHQHVAFGFEADFAESLYFDDYICGGVGDLEELMKTKMYFWSWRTQEVKQLLEWMRDYNTGKSEEEKIHYYGFDCQFTSYQPEYIQEYLTNTLPALWDSASQVMAQVKNLSEEDYNTMTPAIYNEIKTKLESLENLLIENKEQLIANSSSKEYEINKQLLNTIKQALIVNYYYYHGDYSINWRDMFMAENALWIADFFGQDAKITLWAHNYHIAKNPTEWGGGSMGYHLKEKLNNLYQALGFSFSQGSFFAVEQVHSGGYTSPKIRTISKEPLNNSINFIFHHASYPNFAFHLDAIPSGSEWSRWLESPRNILMLGAVFDGVPENYYWRIDILEQYNWINYFDNTTHSDLILIGDY